MKCSLIILLLQVLLKNVYINAQPVDPSPEWGLQYTVKGVLTHLNGEIIEPFEAWYDGINGNSRFDYHGGTVSQYQLSNVGEFGRLYRITPVMNSRKCQKIDVRRVVGTNETEEFKRIKPQSVLPHLDNFKYNGTETILGRNCYRFVMREKLFDDTFYSTSMWVQYKLSSKKHRKSIKYIPVRYEKKNVDGDGEVISWHKIDYESYEPSFKGFSLEKVFKIDDTGCTVAPHFRESLFQRMSSFMESSESIEHDTIVDEPDPSTEDPAADQTEDTDSYEFDARTLARLPESLDWRMLGAVSPVRDQTNVCGSCWAFAAVSAVEGALFIHTGMKELIRLSEQALVDCVWTNGNDGCVGGFESEAFEWIRANGGIPTDESYGKYKAIEGICHANDSEVVSKAPITGWVSVRSGDSNAMKLALIQNGPIAVTIHATERFLHFARSDSAEVFYDPDCKSTAHASNHAVLIVGYGENESGEEYWIVRNSHGVEWGDDGYMLMAARDNHCGVLTDPVYPIFDFDLYE